MGVKYELVDYEWLTCSYFIYNPHRRREVWRFITYMFLHGNHEHISFNCILQVVIGNRVMIGSGVIYEKQMVRFQGYHWKWVSLDGWVP